MNAKLISTIIGIIMAIISIIGAIGLITQEQAATLTEWLPKIVEAIGAILLAFGVGKLELKNLF